METEFGKALGGGLYEFRLRRSAAEVQRKVEGVSAETAAKVEKIMLQVQQPPRTGAGSHAR